jgi:hypothetical protein
MSEALVRLLDKKDKKDLAMLLELAEKNLKKLHKN